MQSGANTTMSSTGCRGAKGVKAQSVYQAADNPNDITVTHDFANLEAAQAFAKSDELKTAMHGAGVVGAPTIWFTHKA
jgi:hypothetical protein